MNLAQQIDEWQLPEAAKGRRVLAKGAARRERILDAAEQLILDGHQMTTVEIQKTARMAGGTIYEYFPSIHHLVRLAYHRLLGLVKPKA